MNITKWNEAFDTFMQLSLFTRQCLKSAAITALVNGGVDEVGSSDINHELFQKWSRHGGDWNQVVINYVETT